MRNLSYENEFCMQFHFHANQSHFHKNGFALRLALKQRHKRTLIWPIECRKQAGNYFVTLLLMDKINFHPTLFFFLVSLQFETG